MDVGRTYTCHKATTRLLHNTNSKSANKSLEKRFDMIKPKARLLLEQKRAQIVASHIQRSGCQPEKLLYTVANPARGLLNREKEKKNKKSGSAPPPPPRALLVRRK